MRRKALLAAVLAVLTAAAWVPPSHNGVRTLKAEDDYLARLAKAPPKRGPGRLRRACRLLCGAPAALSSDDVPRLVVLGHGRTSSLGYEHSRVVENYLESLPPLSRDVLAGGTEPANQGETACGLHFEQLRPIFREKRPAVFATALGSLPVFSSADALDLTSGWPAFRRPIAPDHVLLRPDGEVLCARSGAHLGHRVSEDYYCINAAALVVLQPGDALPGGAVPGARVEELPPVLAAVLGGKRTSRSSSTALHLSGRSSCRSSRASGRSKY